MDRRRLVRVLLPGCLLFTQFNQGKSSSGAEGTERLCIGRKEEHISNKQNRKKKCVVGVSVTGVPFRNPVY